MLLNKTYEQYCKPECSLLLRNMLYSLKKVPVLLEEGSCATHCYRDCATCD